MNNRFKPLIEKVVSEMKENDNGKMQVTRFHHLVGKINKYKIDDGVQRLLVRRVMEVDLQLIEKVNSSTICLSQKGWNFTSFKEIEEEKREQEKKEQLEIDSLKATISANELNERNEKRNLLYTRINVAIGIVNLVFFIYQIFYRS